MLSLHDTAARERLMARFRTIPADRAPAWGRLTAPRMVVHCTEAVRMATGDLPIRPLPISLVLQFSGIGPLLARRMPFPKGAPTHPKLLARAPDVFTDELDRLDDACEAFAQKSFLDAWPKHPLFGQLSARDWGILAGRHLVHHLEQFGA